MTVERPTAPKSAISSGVKQHKAATTMPMTPVATSRLSDMHERIVEARLTGLSILRHPSVIGSLCRALERNRLGSIGGALDFAALIMGPARFALSGFTYRRRAVCYRGVLSRC